MQDYFIKDTSGDLKAIINTDFEKLKKVNEMYEAIDLFINSRRSLYDQSNAIEEMKNILKEIEC